jgi:YggT family protein
VSIVLQLIYVLLYAFLLMLLGRLVMEYVLMFSRRWQPGRGAAATMELMWSTTDPPLKALRRVIPPLRVGGVSLDLGFMLLLMIVFVLMRAVGGLM